MLQLGFFIFFNLIAFGFMFYGLKNGAEVLGKALYLMSMVLFFIIGFSVLLDEQEGIGTETTYLDNFNMNITETKIFIDGASSIYLVYTYWGMALITFLGFMFSGGLQRGFR